ncbi:hypothetical protein VE01_03808 [Pseudogymnoascus verrucosus]|uniref:Uncharacterized protein n=1 Tax=Pseudogymnoascus verrucosus TaxID=342668 RepID=A0A1B8GQL6_9PEZI|nr:uncharacterized protein VE01_03808 [Pseudogymnoascus verrucosus]OBT98131.1 hypothetical protein VE01_03808 [Pseudogymnoascus verrucosus]
MPATPTTNLNPPPPSLPTHPFTSIRKTRSIIAQQLDQLCFGTSRTQYLLFSSLPPSRFTTLSLGRYDGRHTLPKCVRLTYDAGKEEMVAKLMGEARLESSDRLLEWWIFSRARGMGMDWEELLPEGATTCRKEGVEREPDSSYRPRGRGRDGWPTVVTLVGFKEVVEGLRWDAGWWVGGSEGEVRVAIIIILGLDEREIVLETWEPSRDETKRVTRSAAKQVTRTQEVCISKDEVEGAPLVLGFEKVFGRAAGEGEGDIVFSAQDLGQWARKVWLDDED